MAAAENFYSIPFENEVLGDGRHFAVVALHPSYSLREQLERQRLAHPHIKYFYDEVETFPTYMQAHNRGRARMEEYKKLHPEHQTATEMFGEGREEMLLHEGNPLNESEAPSGAEENPLGGEETLPGVS